MANKKLVNYPAYFDDTLLIKIASNKVFGFWIYLMSDCVLFATLFATFAVLSSGNANAQNAKNIFDLRDVLTETICLLCSSFTFGLAILAMQQNNKKLLIAWLCATFFLGAAFLALEFNEFYHLTLNGNGPDHNAFFSSFFTLLGTHGLHVFLGLIWIVFMIIQVMKKGIYLTTKTRLILLSLFWHFLDIIWIFLFSFVYLIGFTK
jgi:cytochrome o ubiquinol oxidase subunit 3